MIVASIRMPAASPVASVLMSVSGPDAMATNARNRINAALVTKRPVRPMPRMTASSVAPVASYSSRMRARIVGQSVGTDHGGRMHEDPAHILL